MASCKFPPGARLQITLKRRRLVFIAKGDCGFNSPRFEFRAVRDLARVVCGEALIQIGCHSDVVALGRNLASGNIDIVKHVLFANAWLAKP